MNMRILVTGSTGLLGNNVARQLLKGGHEVRALVRRSHDPRSLQGLDLERATGDVCDLKSIEAAMHDVSTVIHCAGCVKIGWSELDTHQQVNVEGTRNVASAAHQRQIRLIHVSSINALGMATKTRTADESWADPGIVPCPYVVTKQQAERVIDELVADGLDAAVVNPGFMLGPWDWKPSSGQMVLQVARRWTPISPSGGVSVCDVRDVATAAITAIEKAGVGQRYVLGGENMPYFQLWKLIAEVTGSKGPWISARPLQRIIAGAYGDIWGRFTQTEPEINSAAVKLSSQRHFFSSHRAQQELDYHSRPVRESIQDSWKWFSEHGFLHPAPATPST